jgi:hypothetical protein
MALAHRIKNQAPSNSRNGFDTFLQPSCRIVEIHRKAVITVRKLEMSLVVTSSPANCSPYRLSPVYALLRMNSYVP